jgi:hypothetical protein
MGGVGSGRFATALEAKSRRSHRLPGAAKMGWKVIDQTLREAGAALHPPEGEPIILPPASVIALAQWAVEMMEGKPTVRSENLNVNVPLTPVQLESYILSARSQAVELLSMSGMDTQPDQSSSQNVYCANKDDAQTMPSPMIAEASTHEYPGLATMSALEVRWRSEASLRIVSYHAENSIQNDPTLHNGEGI